MRVDHAIGSLQRPLSDAQLEAKFDALVAPVLGQARGREIAAHWRTLASLRRRPHPDRALPAVARPLLP